VSGMRIDREETKISQQALHKQHGVSLGVRGVVNFFMPGE